MLHKRKERRLALRNTTRDGLPGGRWKSVQGLRHFAVLVITLRREFNVQTAQARNSSPAVRRKKVGKSESDLLVMLHCAGAVGTQVYRSPSGPTRQAPRTRGATVPP
jgi:hypothetical protein